MRVFSFAQESTRYCNYTKDKFGKELTFILPCWCPSMVEGEINEDNPQYQCSSESENDLLTGLAHIEKIYFDLIEQGWKPQEAATILPNALKTELIMTGFKDDWCHFFSLRALGTTGAPHPQAKELAKPLMEEFSKRGYIR